MAYDQTAKDILRLIGGEKNVESAAHCATRLRLVLADDKLAQKDELEKLSDVKGVFSSAGQYQIILGQGTVNKVYEEFAKLGNFTGSADDAKRAAMKKMNPIQRFARTLSNIFVPIIPAIVASGLLMGLLGLGSRFEWWSSDSALFTMLDMFSNAAFVFLPVLIAFSAAREFGGNPYLAAALGAIMIHPNLQNAWTLGDGIKESIDLFGIQVSMVGYQGTVLPVLIAVWLMTKLERAVRKVVPNVLDILLTPFITLMVSAFFTLLVIGPIGRLLGDGLSMGLQFIYNAGALFAGLIFGALYPLIVITGVHHSFHAVEAGLLANPNIGVNFLLPIWSMANVAQGGAAFAVWLRTRSPKMKSVALPAGISALLGITEPAIFGVNLRYGKPFIAALIGGSAGGAVVAGMRVGMTGVGVTGIPGTAIVRPDDMLWYLIGFAVAVAVGFIMTLILGFDRGADDEAEADVAATTAQAAPAIGVAEPAEVTTAAAVDGSAVAVATGTTTILAPASGKVISLDDVPDPTFSQRMMGDGLAVEVSEGRIVAPVDGEISALFPTGHAIGITTASGVELLIHIGLETVSLEQGTFTPHVEQGDEVKAGDLLVTFDLDDVSGKVPSMATPIIVTNGDDVGELHLGPVGETITAGQELYTVG